MGKYLLTTHVAGWYAMKTTTIPVLPGTQHLLRRFTNAGRCFLTDGIHHPDTIATRISAYFVNLLCNCEPQRFKAAALDAIEELSRVIQTGSSTLYVVVYGTKRAYFAAKLITSGRLAHHIKLVLIERELTCGLLTIPRIFTYQIDTDRYPFTDEL
jgi:hypothetical protein